MDVEDDIPPFQLIQQMMQAFQGSANQAGGAPNQNSTHILTLYQSLKTFLDLKCGLFYQKFLFCVPNLLIFTKHFSFLSSRSPNCARVHPTKLQPF